MVERRAAGDEGLSTRWVGASGRQIGIDVRGRSARLRINYRTSAEILRWSMRVLAGSSGSEIVARVIAIDARVDRATRNALVRAELPNLATLPAPGSSVRVQVPVGASRTAVVVPVSALRKGPGGDHVFVLGPTKDGQTRAQLRLVKTGPVLGDEIVIVDGLASGERVAASGSFKLRDAALVAVADTAAAKRVSIR